MGLNIEAGFRLVQPGKNTMDVNPLLDGRVALKVQPV